jgi:hypothetical protein
VTAMFMQSYLHENKKMKTHEKMRKKYCRKLVMGYPRGIL